MNARRRRPESKLLEPKLAELVEAIGFAATLKLVERWGGVRLYVPKEENLAEEHGLVKELGRDAAAKLARMQPGEWLEVPRAARYLRMVRNKVIRDAGQSARHLARRYGMTRRNVFYIRAAEEREEEELQGDLFGGAGESAG